jgi:hypothetical protein
MGSRVAQPTVAGRAGTQDFLWDREGDSDVPVKNTDVFVKYEQ